MNNPFARYGNEDEEDHWPEHDADDPLEDLRDELLDDQDNWARSDEDGWFYDD